jgi:peptidoglycan L-alanyl-D-glutamate endopeptidase CwlK
VPAFGKRSRENRASIDQRLKRVVDRAIQQTDFAVLCGHRTQAAQDAAYPTYSKVRWPHSRHNSSPSQAVDVAPWPINWKDEGRFYFLAGVIYSCAYEEGVRITGGFDWRWDLGHFELRED